MKKAIITLGLTLLFAAAVMVLADETSDMPKAKYVTSFDEAKELAATENKPIIIDFYTDWCTWCKKFDKEVMTDPKAIEFLDNNVIFAKINAEVDTNVSQAYKIMGFPTFVVAKADGEEYDRVAGYLPTEDFIKTVNDYQNGIGTLGDLLNKSKDNQDRSLYFEIADKYKYRGETKDAEDWFDKIIAGANNDSIAGEAFMAIGDMYRRDKKKDEALGVYKKVVVDFAGTPFEGQGMMFIGHTLRAMDNYEEALGTYNQVMNKFKGSDFEQEGEIYRAIAYRDKGDTTQAIIAFQGFIEHWPNSEDVEYSNKQIRKLRGE